MELYHWIYFILLFIAASVGTIRFKKLNTSSKIMLLLVFITIVSESVATYLKISKHSNIIVYHIFGPIEAAFIVWAFFVEFRWKLLFFIIGGLILFGIINSLFLQSYKFVFNSYFFVIDALMAVILSVLYFIKLLNQKELFRFTDYPMFWISTGFLIFYLTNLAMLGTFNVVKIENRAIFNFFLQVRSITNFFLYILFVVGFASKQKKLQIH